MLSWIDQKGKLTVKATHSEEEHYQILFDISFLNESKLVRSWRKDDQGMV